MMHRRQWLAAAAAVAGIGMPDARAADRFTVILDWLLNPNHAALFAAQQGAFAAAGLAVDLVAPSDPDTPCRLVAAGQADVAVGYGSQINLIDDAGLPLVRIATLIGSPLNTVMALGRSGIRSLADLKGRRVGVSVGGVEDALLDAMLHSAGLAESDVTVTKVSYGMVPALLSGRLDAAIGAFRNAEVLQVRQMGLAPVVFLPEQHGVPIYDELILVARRDRVTDPRLHQFVTALRKGTSLLLHQPQSLWTAFAAAHPELDNPLTRASWFATLPLVATDPARLDAPRYLAFQDFALAHGMIHARLKLDQFAVEL